MAEFRRTNQRRRLRRHLDAALCAVQEYIKKMAPSYQVYLWNLVARRFLAFQWPDVLARSLPILGNSSKLAAFYVLSRRLARAKVQCNFPEPEKNSWNCRFPRS